MFRLEFLEAKRTKNLSMITFYNFPNHEKKKNEDFYFLFLRVSFPSHLKL